MFPTHCRNSHHTIASAQGQASVAVVGAASNIMAPAEQNTADGTEQGTTSGLHTGLPPSTVRVQCRIMHFDSELMTGTCLPMFLRQLQSLLSGTQL